MQFTLSTWDAYNVFHMKSDLAQLEPADTGETVLVVQIPIPEA